MKKAVIVIFVILFQQFIFAQKNQYYDFMKAWNFIKYYHPDVARGKVDADSLFLSTVKNISSKDDFNTVIGKLSQNLNKKFTTPAPAETSKDILVQNQNFDWFQKNGKINSENKNFLTNIYKNRYNFELLKEGKFVSDEKKYPFTKTENLPLEYRLLTLAKIQGTVDYLFPHKYLMDKNFDSFFKNLLEEAIKSPSRKDFEVILAKAISQFQDSHALSFYKQLNYRNEIFFNLSYYSPFDFQIVDNHLLVTNLIFPEICEKAQIKVGDKITEINGKSIPEIVKEKNKLLSVSNHQKLLYVLSQYENNLIWSDNQSQKKLKVQSGYRKFSTEITLIDVTDKSQTTILAGYVNDKNHKKESRRLDRKDIAYFKINETLNFINNVADDKIDAVIDSILSSSSKKKAIVFDMRAYPDWGGFPYHYIYKYFSPKENYFGKYYKPNLKNIGTFVYKDYDYFPTIDNKTNHVYKGKVFILVNPETRSASEWYSMSLQKIFPQSLTIGQQTSGADGDLVKVNLPGDYLLEFTGNGIFYPDNSQTQQVGIKIDELIPYKDQDILNNRDLEFERVLNSVK